MYLHKYFYQFQGMFSKLQSFNPWRDEEHWCNGQCVWSNKDDCILKGKFFIYKVSSQEPSFYVRFMSFGQGIECRNWC